MEQIKESLSVFFVSPAQDFLALMLWCIFTAVLVSLFYLRARRATLGKAVQSLIREGCVDPESARSAAELGIPSATEAKLANPTERLIVCVEEEGTKRYYIPSDRVRKAQYLAGRADSGFWMTVGSIVGLYFVLVILYHLLPIIFPDLYWNFQAK